MENKMNTNLSEGQIRIEDVNSYEEGKIVKSPLYKSDNTVIVLASFSAGQEMKPHTSPMDAVLQILEGEAVIHLDGTDHVVGQGEMILLPAGIPHGLKAVQNFRVLITKSAK